MRLKPIKNEKDYQNALERLEVIFDASIRTREGDEAEILSLLIENYENEHYPIEPPDPIEAIKIQMEELNMQQKDLENKYKYLDLELSDEPTISIPMAVAALIEDLCKSEKIDNSQWEIIKKSIDSYLENFDINKI